MTSRQAAIAVQLALLALAAAAPPTAVAMLSLTTTAAPTFSDNLDLGDQAATYTAALTAKDTSNGTSPGWHLTITSTQLTTSSGTPHSLSPSASSITSVSSSCGAGSCIDPINTVTYPVTVPAANTAPAPAAFYDAAANTGQGTFTIRPTVRVTIPQNSYAGTYTSTLTLAIASGP